MSVVFIYDENPLDSVADADSLGWQVDIAPFQRTNFSDSHSCTQTDIDSEIVEGEIIDGILHNTPLMAYTQYFLFLLLLLRRIFHTPLREGHISVLLPNF